MPSVPQSLTTRSQARSSNARPQSTTSSSLTTHVRVLSSVSNSSSSSTTSYCPTSTRRIAMTAKARCEQSASKPPIITAGEITPDALRTREMGCKQYFRIKTVDEANHVPFVAWNLQDPCIQDWYSNDAERLNKLDFNEFVAEVRKVWLPSDWDATLRQKMLSNMQGLRTFHDWSVEVESQNAMLRGTKSHLDENTLMYRVSGHGDKDDFRKWLGCIRMLDDERQLDIKLHNQAIEDALRQAGRTFSARVTSQSTTASSNAFKDGNKLNQRLAVLTAEERMLLNANRRCYKCRHFFQGHTSHDCPNGFPDPKTYKILTEDDARASKSKAKPKPIASVEVTGFDDTMNHEECMCIIKGANYDLLNPPPPPKLKKEPANCQWIKYLVVAELCRVLPELKEIIDEECEPVKGVDVVAAINNRIDQVSMEEDFKHRNENLKKEYEDRFPMDIPHNDSLPSDVQFRVKLKDADKITQGRSYDCPQKFHAAWKTLLDQHIAAGRIRPSSMVLSS
ncbi:hypothetical protein PAXRUDRAFT_20343 [Paxillus rubicundulus Ve08.2h10]|uniref:Uncharacterized protein n=1 Tax=Paxillus rubicundulus Ve08.2h10 TaxID=930991 RepID=A0A0D0D281_9AGAM|nr:hypothetical protein PAXRUDRAFT_20343 [Paxillus rubicundulus Ve08.2h10]